MKQKKNAPPELNLNHPAPPPTPAAPAPVPQKKAAGTCLVLVRTRTRNQHVIECVIENSTERGIQHLRVRDKTPFRAGMKVMANKIGGGLWTLTASERLTLKAAKSTGKGEI